MCVRGWAGALIKHTLTFMWNGIIWNKLIYLMSGCLSCNVLISYNDVMNNEFMQFYK